MDAMIQSYMEETEEMLQRAEECVIRLEMEYSTADVNELFRIAHTIKGSSHMVGYEDIGNLMHKIEDMLDCARNGSITFDQSIVSLCFEGLDTVKKMLQYKKGDGSQELIEKLVNTASRISEMVEVFIRVNKKEEAKPVVVQQEIGIVSSLLNKRPTGKNQFFITFFIEEDAPMVSPVLLIILNTADEIGTLVYSSLGDKYFSGSQETNDIKTFDIILSTNIDETELYTYFALFYIEKINIADLSRSRLEAYDYYFADEEYNLHLINLKAFMQIYRIILSLSKEFKVSEKDIDQMKSLHTQAVNAFAKIKGKNAMNNFISDFNSLYSRIIKIHDGKLPVDVKLCTDMHKQMGKLIERAYNFIKGKHIVSIFKCEKDSFIDRLNNFIGLLNKSSVFILLMDLSNLTILKENEVKDLINIKRQLEVQNIEIAIIIDGFDTRRIINIFDSIRMVEEFSVYRSEIDAILGIFDSEVSYQKINQWKKEGENVE